MSNIFEKFDANIDVAALAKDVADFAGNSQGEYKEVPYDTYEVKVEKMELKESKKGLPMMTIWFKIISEGEFKGNYIFMNQVLVEPFQVHIAKEFLKSLDSGVEVTFESYSQFNNLLLDIHENIDKKLEYVLDYGVDKKGYNTYKILDIFEV